MCWIATIDGNSTTGIKIAHVPNAKFTNGDKWVSFDASGFGKVVERPVRGSGYVYARTKDEAIEWGIATLTQQVVQQEQFLMLTKEKREQFKREYGLEG